MKSPTRRIPVLSVLFRLEEWEDFKRVLQRSQNSVVAYLQAAANTVGFKNIISHFEREEGPGEKWQKRAPSTQAMYEAIQAGMRKVPKGGRRAAYNPTNKVLQLTGRTKNSLLPNRAKAHREGQLGVKLVAATEYSGYLDEGTKRMPARSFMWFSNDAKEDMARIVLDLFETGGKK